MGEPVPGAVEDAQPLKWGLETYDPFVDREGTGLHARWFALPSPALRLETTSRFCWKIPTGQTNSIGVVSAAKKSPFRWLWPVLHAQLQGLSNLPNRIKGLPKTQPPSQDPAAPAARHRR
jgi:hypothetical protein